MISANTAPDKFKNATIIGHFGFTLEETPGRKITKQIKKLIKGAFWK